MTKEEILDAIRRTAQENNGKPLGKDRFERATGITAYDLNRYWARFTDAQREAGFEPNTLQSAYGDGFLLDKLARLVLELKKYPTKAERRLKSFNDSTFPSPNTFDRLGNKNKLLSMLVKFCEERPEYAEVVEIIGPIAEDIQDNDISSTDYKENERYGFVYLVKGHPGEYKIGRTNLIDRRLSELGATASIEQTLVHEIKTDDPAGIESYWHKRFQDKRMKGEWFLLSPSDIRAFKKWRRIY